MPTLFKRDLSIIIPVYNLEHYIEPMIESIKAQKLGRYKVEVIFVLNNCTDNSEEVIRQSGIRCKILYCFKQGCGPARNTGMDIATGKFIWFMDGDDWLVTNTAIKDALDMAQGFNIIRIPFDSDLFLYDYFSMVWQYVMRREFIEDVRFPDYQPSEDDAFMQTVLTRAGYDRNSYKSLPTLSEPKYFYNYMREGSNMQRYSHGEKI